VLTLSITPLRILTGINELIKTRRMVGLFSFFYGVIHFLTYSVFDKSGEPLLIADDVVQRPFIAIGMAVLLILIPLAATSTNRMVKRLGGRNWARLHRLTYLAAMLGVVHYWMSVKSDITYPAIFGIAVAGLLGYRIYAKNYGGRSRGN
jgi:sulfoxide reductase heme-binding subunit YedZ